MRTGLQEHFVQDLGLIHSFPDSIALPRLLPGTMWDPFHCGTCVLFSPNTNLLSDTNWTSDISILF